MYSWGEIESSGRKRSDVEKTENGINKVGSANGGFGRRSGGVCFVPPRKKVIVFFFGSTELSCAVLCCAVLCFAGATSRAGAGAAAPVACSMLGAVDRQRLQS